ncbi:hypothetical protein M422DRAFT_261019 [Sphaerobolus stellatus SS14]|uniref:Uncharacterized protein n=1 Tax=Sphaerobolus stellatus (strain SS14) TaxID=990650 RepID=A0A0C9UPE9_SPHS4|nr:hypothetical protein M422DRAFT_261019 [Sphaerobolus stellatus SS14]
MEPSTSRQAAEPLEPNTHSSNEDQPKPNKAKCSFNELGLPWFGKPELILDPRIKKTLEQKQYYLTNPKQVKQPLLRQADFPLFPDSLWINVICGKYIDFNKVCSACFSLTPNSNLIQSIGDNNIAVWGNRNSGRTTKQVQNVTDWTLTFHTMKVTILSLCKEHMEELNIYEESVMGQFSAPKPSEHHHVIDLNKAIRKQATSINNCTYCTIPNFNGLITQYLNTFWLGSSNSYGPNPAGPLTSKWCREESQVEMPIASMLMKANNKLLLFVTGLLMDKCISL